MAKGAGSVQRMNGSASAWVTYFSAVSVGALGPARQVRMLACRVIGQIADRFRVSEGDQAARRLLGSERAQPAAEPALAASAIGRESISLPKPRESAGISEVLRGGEPTPERIDLQVLLRHLQISPIIRVGEVPGSNPGAPTQKTPQSRGFLLGRRPSRSGWDWAQTLECVGVAKLKSGFKQGFCTTARTGSRGAVPGRHPAR
jgi:hypothetical protein